LSIGTIAHVSDCRGDSLDGGVEIVGLAREEDDVISRLELVGDDRVRREMKIAERTLDAQAVALQLFAPLRSDQERDVGTTFRQPPAEIPANSTCAEDEEPHSISLRSSVYGLRSASGGGSAALTPASRP
jgi:hypothetical protein